MKLGDKINVRYNWELLNKVLKTDYKGWMQSVYEIDSNRYIWMICLDGEIHQDWKNTFSPDFETITEEYLGDNCNSKIFQLGKTHITRYVFQKVEFRKVKYFIYRGVYELLKTENGDKLRILKRNLKCNPFEDILL